MSLRISHVISRKILKWYIKPTCTCKEGTCNNVWRNFRKCLFGLKQSEGSFLRKFGVGYEFKPTSGHKVLQRLFPP